MARWWGVCLPVQETRIWSLTWADPTCCGAAGPVCHYFWALEPRSLNYWNPCTWRAHVPTRQASTMTSSHSTTKEWLPLPTTRENPHSNKEPAQPKINLKKKFFFKTGNMGRGRRTSLSFWSRQHASIISSSSRLSRVVFLSLCSQARSTNYCFLCGQRACLRGH